VDHSDQYQSRGDCDSDWYDYQSACLHCELVEAGVSDEGAMISGGGAMKRCGEGQGLCHRTDAHRGIITHNKGRQIGPSLTSRGEEEGRVDEREGRELKVARGIWEG